MNSQFYVFVQGCLKSYLLKIGAMLSEIHNNCLRKFILSAFDMAREIQITPRRILYAQEREKDLYDTLMILAIEKQEEITSIIKNTLQEMKNDIDGIIEDYKQGLCSKIFLTLF